MFSMKCFQAAAFATALVVSGFAGLDASAGHDRHNRSCDRGSYSRVSATYGGDHYRVSVSIGSSSKHCYSDRRVTYRRGHDRHADYGRHYETRRVTYRSSSRCDTTPVRYVEVRPPSGYWTSVYRPPVYETRYDRCGNPYRVCVREGYYERVWVSTGDCRY
ncbi:MAG: hypothetical protein ACE37H_16305 [Phycisphaeraceae bacterium]